MLRRRRMQLSMVLALLGFTACATAGGTAAALSAAGAAAVLGAHLRTGPAGQGSLRGWRVANGCVLIVCVVVAVFWPSVRLLAGLVLVGWLQVHRAWGARTAADARVGLLLSLLLVLLGCILTVSVWLAPVFVVAAVLAPVLLALIHLDDAYTAHDVRHRGDIGLGRWLLVVGPASLALTMLFFVGIPRMDGAGIGAQAGVNNVAGFDRNVELGDLGAILANPDVVMRVRARDTQGDALRGPLYLRGVALDHFDGRRWADTIGGRVSHTGRREPEAGTMEQRIMLEPIGQSIVFGLEDIVNVRGLTGLTVDTSGSWRFAGDGARVEYVVESRPRVGERNAPSRVEKAALRSGIWTSLPPDLDPRVRELADSIVDTEPVSSSQRAQALAIESFLRREYTYTAVPEVDDVRQPLSDFLFTSKQGHCEFFATALAVLLRVRGIPARVVNGFYGGEFNDFGEFVLVRQNDAHSWVEAWLGTSGWTRLDATPARESSGSISPVNAAVEWGLDSWNRVVLDFDLDTQLEGLSFVAARASRSSSGPGGGLSSRGGAGALAMVVIFGLFTLGRGLLRFAAGERTGVSAQRSASAPVERIHRRARRLVARRGWRVPEGLPPLRAAEWLQCEAGVSAAPLEEIAWALYRTRYGGESVTRHAREARQALKALRKLESQRGRTLATGRRIQGKHPEEMVDDA